MRAALTDEHVRILRAVAAGHLTVNAHGRYVIYADPKRPDRRSREQLAKRGLIAYDHIIGAGSYWRITAKGKAALASVGAGGGLT